MFLGCLLNSLAAYGFAFFQFKGKKLFYGLVLLSFMIPFESIAIPLYKVVDQFHWVDTYKGLIIPTVIDGFVLFYLYSFLRIFQPDFLRLPE